MKFIGKEEYLKICENTFKSYWSIKHNSNFTTDLFINTFRRYLEIIDIQIKNNLFYENYDLLFKFVESRLFEEKDIELCIDQTNSRREDVLISFFNNNKDVVNTIMELSI